MAAKKVLFWLSIGVINIDGKDYGAEMPLPVDKIGKDDLKKMIADGRIGEKIAPVITDGRDNQIADLKSELAEVTIGAKKTIKGLEKDIKNAGSGDETLKDDIEEKAALIDQQKITIAENEGEIKRLTEELEEATKPEEDKK